MGIRIEYGGVALGAKDDFSVEVSEKTDFSSVSDLEKEGLVFGNYGNPCEMYSVLLDGNTEAIPDDTSDVHIGWWSEQISGEDGVFERPIIAEFIADSLYASSGILLTFDDRNNIYATNIQVDWYKDNQLISSRQFKPDKSVYFCSQKIEFYNKVVITFNSINMPLNRLRLCGIDYGMMISFSGSDLMSAKVIQEVNPISSNLPIGTCDFTINSKKNIEYVFEEQQPISVFFDEQLISTTFIKSSERKSKTVWDVKSEDYIGILDDITYHGGIYEQKNAFELLSDIFGTAGVPFSVSESIKNANVTGHIPYTNCRQALMQVLFAVGAIVDTSNIDLVSIVPIPETKDQTVGLKRIMQGQKLNDRKRVTSVEVFLHSYSKSGKENKAFDSEKNGVGDNILVIFNSPLYDLSIENGEIVESSENHAIINAKDNCVLTGFEYAHNTSVVTRKNHLSLTSDSENIVSVQSATLVSVDNIDNVMEMCYNYYTNTKTATMKIIDGKHEKKQNAIFYGQAKYGDFRYGDYQKNVGYDYDTPTRVGSVIEFETPYMGNLSGVITRQKFNLNGGVLVKDTLLERVI